MGAGIVVDLPECPHCGKVWTRKHKCYERKLIDIQPLQISSKGMKDNAISLNGSIHIIPQYLFDAVEHLIKNYKKYKV